MRPKLPEHNPYPRARSSRIKSHMGGNSKIACYILKQIELREWITAPEVMRNYHTNLSRQYVSSVFDKLERDQLVRCSGTIGRTKYYVFVDSQYPLAFIRSCIEAARTNKSQPRPTIWMGDRLSPVEFLNRLIGFNASFGKADDEWDFERDIKPLIYQLVFAHRGHHSENDLIQARAQITSYVEELNSVSNMLQHILDNPHLASGAVAEALPDITVNNYLDRHTHNRDIA